MVRTTIPEQETDMGGSSSSESMYGAWNIFYSTGNAMNSYPFAWANAPVLDSDGYSNANLLMVADLNGDGKTDIWHSLDFYNSSTNILQSKHTIYYSHGEPLPGQNSQSAFDIFTDTTATSINVDEGKNAAFGDFNGDGKPDIMTVQGNNVLFIYPFPNKEDHLMVKAVDGLGAETDFTYDRLNNGVIYNQSNPAVQNSNYTVINGPLIAISGISKPNGIGGTATIHYSYTDAVSNPLRGFLGFKQVRSTNAATGIQYTTISDINPQFLLPHTTRKYMLDGSQDTVSETFISDTLIAQNANASDKRSIYHLNREVSVNNLTGAASETDNTYDAYGNITTQTMKTGGLIGSIVATPIETSTTTSTFGTYNTPVPAYPSSVTVSSTRSGSSSVSKQTTFTYDAKGNIMTSVSFAGTANAVTSNYAYDGYGNDTSLIVSASGINNRKIGKTMDAQGRFLLSARETGSGITRTATASYNDWGSPLTKKSSAGLITAVQYDGFNRPVQTTTPEGYNITTSYAWETATGRYSVATSQPGGGSNTKTWYDILGRAIQKQVSGYNGQYLTQNNTYNGLGQVVSATKPHYSAEAATAISYTYDNDDRVTKVTSPINYVSYSYAALSNGQYKVTTTNSAGQNSSKTTDATGAVIAATDNGGTVNYTYDSWGNQLTASAGGKTMITNVYNSYGQRTSTADINIGTYSYQYNALGQLIKQTDPLSHVYNLTYDDFGRLLTKTGAEGTTTYTYYNNATTGYNSDQPVKIVGFGGEETDYTYDNLMRLQTKKITVGGTAYTTSFGYDTYSDQTSVTYPDGLVINSTFDNNGILTKKAMQSGATNTTLFTAAAMNSAGVYTGYSLSNGKASQVTYDLTAGKPTRYYTAGIQDLNFVFDANTGNLTSRKDAINNLTETFTYDNLNRLTGSKLNNVQQLSLQYDNASGTSYGNIIQKSDAGNYVYNNTKINQLSYVTDTGGNQMLSPPNISQNLQTIGYTPFLMTDSIAQNGNTVHFTYAYDENRIKSVLSANGVVTETRYFLGDFEVQVKGGVTRYIHYIGAGNGLSAIITSQGGTVTPYYVYSDYLGSILTVTDGTGTAVAQQNFDAWGRNRNPANWTYANVPSVPDWLYRGYTGHEMLPQFALINMNGRMYDPVIGKMLAPDINIPDPYSAAGYNRYEYAMNNPLSNVDPSGWLSEAAIQDIFNELNNNSDPYGASYTPGEAPGGGSGGSWTSFGSDAGTFDAGALYATEFGLWGKYGFAPSFAYAQGAYYLQYNGRDPGVAALLPPIVVVGKIVNDQWQTSHVFYPGQYTEDKNGVITVQWGGEQHGVGAPGFWEGAIPVWGNTRNAVNDFQTGHWGWGIAHSLLAVSDVFLVKSIFTGIAKLGVEAAVDASVNTASTTVYRAVDATEAASINNTGQFFLQEGGTEVKYFAQSVEDAHWYGQQLYPNGYSIIQGTVMPSVDASKYWFPYIDIGAYAFPKDVLPNIIPH